MNGSKVLTAMVLVGLLFVLAPSANAELIAHYEFDSNFDYTVGVANGTGHGGAAVSTSEAKVGAGSLALDGTGDYLDFGDNYDFGTGDFTIAMWVKLADKGADRNQLIHKQGTGAENRGVQMFVEDNAPTPANSGLPGGYVTDGTSGVSPFGASAVYDGGWHHVALTVDRDGNALVYVDGSAGTALDASGASGTLDNSAYLYLGHTSSTGARDAEGFIDDFRIYNHALSQAEITALVPEPSMFVLLGMGALGLLVVAFRRDKTRK